MFLGAAMLTHVVLFASRWAWNGTHSFVILQIAHLLLLQTLVDLLRCTSFSKFTYKAIGDLIFKILTFFQQVGNS